MLPEFHFTPAGFYLGDEALGYGVIGWQAYPNLLLVGRRVWTRLEIGRASLLSMD